MCGPPISQSAWIVRRRTRRSRYSSGILRKSFGSTLSLNWLIRRLLRTNWSDLTPLRDGHPALVRWSERLHGTPHRAQVAGAWIEDTDDRDVQPFGHLREFLARLRAVSVIPEGRHHALGHRARQLVVARAL